jgi:hypothetical protein
MRSLKFIQIAYKKEHCDEMYEFAYPWLHWNLNDYFENQVIADAVPLIDDRDLISFCSWRLKAKRQDSIRTKGPLTEESLRTLDYDVAILTPRSNNHQPMTAAATWHHPNWTPAIEHLRNEFNIPKEVTHTIYENHFVARADMYKHYVTHWLRPVMSYMDQHPEVYRAPSGYAKYKTEEERQIVKAKLGLEDWPIGVFILERLFSIYLEVVYIKPKRELKVIPL